MLCDICGKDGARIRRVAETFSKGDDLLIIEEVPLIVCPHCGESYFTAQTMHEVERIKLHRKSFAEQRHVEVAKYVA